MQSDKQAVCFHLKASMLVMILACEGRQPSAIYGEPVLQAALTAS